MMIEKNYLKYSIGNKQQLCHIDAVHAQGPRADLFTGKIVQQVINETNCSGIISTISRIKMDINRPRSSKNAPAIDEYRQTIKEILISKNILNENSKLIKPYLHLAIHGMKDQRKTEFEIGTKNGDSCDIEVQDWFVGKLISLSKNIGINNFFPGNASKSYHRNGDSSSNYQGYGDMFHTIQLEINHTWRKKKQIEIVNFLSNILIEFNNEFN